MLIIILDGKTALQGAISGIDLCLRTVIPSLFPFFILTGILSNTIIGHRFSLLQPICRFCKIPDGSASLLILGLLAGYPVGAQLVSQAQRDGNLSYSSAIRMAAFCNNAGPSFIFGILSTMFIHSYNAWFLWGIQIISALIVGVLLPSYNVDPCNLHKPSSISVTKAMERAIKTMASVCGWVIASRILLGFCKIWFLWRFPVAVQVLISGLFELSNGCVRLHEVSSEGLRFVLASILLSAGGLCVTMQTVSVSKKIITRVYFLGKVMQVFITFLLSLITQMLLYSGPDRLFFPFGVSITLCVAVIFGIFIIFRKKI